MNLRLSASWARFALSCLLLTKIANSLSANYVVTESTLDGMQPSTPTGSMASGLALMDVDSSAGLFYLSMYVSGIQEDQLVGAGPNLSPIHFHRGAPGFEGPIVVDASYNWTIHPDGTSGFRLDINGGMFGGVQGNLNGPAPSANLADLLAGNLYINVHTVNFPDGEIRGQIRPVIVPEPSNMFLCGAGFVGLVVRRYLRRRKGLA